MLLGSGWDEAITAKKEKSFITTFLLLWLPMTQFIVLGN
tara:strand:+ start:301 stop:417 length:117 start_codon:yes stop_codon:yes gene_type:complete